MHVNKWLLVLVAALVLLVGARVAGLQWPENPCAGGQYGTNYEECVECIGNENYCSSVFGALGEEAKKPTATPGDTKKNPDKPTATPTAKPKPTVKAAPNVTPTATPTPTPGPTPTVNCQNAQDDYEVCLQCNQKWYCDVIFDR